MSNTATTTVRIPIYVDVKVELEWKAGYPGTRETPEEPPEWEILSFEPQFVDDEVGGKLEDFDFETHFNEENEVG